MTPDRQMRDLRTTLIQAASTGVEREHGVQTGDPTEALGFVLAQISATMLGRVLTFAVDGVPQLVCEAAGRRLMALRAPLPEQANEAQQAFAGMPLKASEPETTALLADLLHASIRPEHQITVTVSQNGRGMDPLAQGISVPQLLEALELDPGILDRQPPTGVLTRFLEAGRAHMDCAAWLVEAELEVEHGTDAALDMLLNQAEAILTELADGRGEVASALAGYGLLILDGRRPGARPMFFATDGQRYVTGLSTPSGVLRLVSLWASLTSGQSEPPSSVG